MLNTEDYYSYGRNLAIRKKFHASKRINFLEFQKKFDYEKLTSNIHKLYNFIVSEQLTNNDVVPPAASWILDNYYLITQELTAFKKFFKKKILSELPLSKLDETSFQVHIIAKKYLEATEYIYNNDNLIQLINGYQKIYPLSSLEVWILPQFLKFELLNNLYIIGTELSERINETKFANSIISKISNDLQNNRSAERHVKTLVKQPQVTPFVLLSVLVGVRELDYAVENIIELIENKLLEEDLNLEEFTRARVLREVEFKQRLGEIIKSLKELSHTKWEKVFEEVSIVEATLKKDPAGIYTQMDANSKDTYRHTVERISKNSAFSESEICRKLINKSSESNIVRQRHIGYYLVDKGYYEFLNDIKYSPSIFEAVKLFILKNPLFSYLFTNTLLVGTISFLSYIIFIFGGFTNNLLTIMMLLQVITGTGLSIYFTNKLFLKLLHPALPPKLKIEADIPEDKKTIVVIPCFASSVANVEVLVENLEKRFLANKSKNLKFALLSDFKDHTFEIHPEDPVIVSKLIASITKLNKKYKAFDSSVFYLFHRKRLFNKSENLWMGWERKRGKLMELVKYVSNIDSKTSFTHIIGDKDQLNDIKYAITLDEDTMLPYGTAKKLVGGISHPLNLPIIDEKSKIVTSGYTFIQPRIDFTPISKSTSKFTELFVDTCGFDTYSVAVSDLYQDLFYRSNFLGKGIFNISAVNEVLVDRFPENSLLSHDLLESCFAHAGLLSDTVLLEDFPSSYQSFVMRDHRWTRGDWQLLPWLKSRIPTKNNMSQKNPLDSLSKWMIIDNLRRSLIPPAYLVLFILAGITSQSILVTAYLILLYFTTSLFELLTIRKYFALNFSLSQKLALALNYCSDTIKKAFVSFVLLGELALSKIDAIISTLVSLIKGNKLLQWVTHSDAELLNTKNINLKLLLSSRIFKVSALYLLVSIFIQSFNLFSILLFLLWLISPIILTVISKPISSKSLSTQVENKDKLLEYAQSIWKFFEENTNKDSNYLPPDNIQIIPQLKVTYKSSPTNIGFYLLSALSAKDLDLISLEEQYSRLNSTIETIEKLPKYKGHLFNWYDIQNLTPLDTYVSTVDSGNLVACLMVTEQTCLNYSQSTEVSSVLRANYLKLAKRLKKIVENTDFSFLYNENRELFSIGFNVSTKKIDSSYYDLLASEARIASYVAIALNQVDAKHWFKLGRSLQLTNGKYYLMSWGGTMFEYLLPKLLLNEQPNTLLDQTNNLIVDVQKDYASKHNIPWGISESSFNSFDFNFNYQYKMLGVPALALRRYEDTELVVSPYSTYLALMVDPIGAEKNLYRLEALDSIGKYGFFEAIDFNEYENEKTKVSKTNVQIYTAHHQGMSLVALNNVLNDKLMIARFHAHEKVKSCEDILQESIPRFSNVIEANQYTRSSPLFKSTSVKQERIRQFKTPNTLYPRGNLYGNGKYSMFITNTGSGYSKYKNTYINRFIADSSFDNTGSYIYIKDIDKNQIWSATYQPTLATPNDYEVKYYSDLALFTRVDDQVSSSLGIFIPPDKTFEVRELTLQNLSSKARNLELTSYSEIMLDEYLNGISHPTFNKLFIETAVESEVLIATRRLRNENENQKYAFHFILDMDLDSSVHSYETDRNKFIGRTNTIQNPIALSKELTNTTGTVLDPIFSIRKRISLGPNELKKIYYIYGYADRHSDIMPVKDLLMAEDSIAELKMKTRNHASIIRNHLAIDIKQEVFFQKILSRIVFPESLMREPVVLRKGLEGDKRELYKYGLSGESSMLSIKVNCKNAELVRNMILLHEYLRLNNFNLDLIFIIDEERGYTHPLEDHVSQIVNNSLSNLYLNSENGVHIIDGSKLSSNERKVILSLSKIVLDSSLGSVEDQINMSSRYGIESLQKNTISTPRYPAEPNLPSTIKATTDLTFYNGIGGFTAEGKEYQMTIEPNRGTPLPWSNIIANKHFGTLVTESGLGYTWAQNSQLNKITPWSNDFVTDDQGEVIYLKNIKSKKYWSATPLPCKNSSFQVSHTQGYSTYSSTYEGISHTLTVFVAVDSPVKILKLEISNDQSTNVDLEISYFVDWVLGENKQKTGADLDVSFNAKNSCIYAINPYQTSVKPGVAFMAVNQDVLAAAGDKRTFFGRNRQKSNPIWVTQRNHKTRGFNMGTDPCGVLTSSITVPPNSKVSMVYILGEGANKDYADELINKFSDLTTVNKELKKVIELWEQKLSTIKVETPDTKFNYLFNNWLLYQVISCRLWGRTAFYQAGGAFGFRDQLQDVMSLIYADPKVVKDQLILACKHQFEEGDVQHWWHAYTGAGVRTKISDDLLWLPYVTNYYIERTGDMSILNETTPFLVYRTLEEHEEDLYVIPEKTEEVYSVYEHCKRALVHASKFGEHGLPLIGTGDWNDGLNSIGDQGKGESIWLGWFLYKNLKVFSTISKKIGNTEDSEYFTHIASSLKQSLNAEGWDGNWFKRAFHDDGSPLGSETNNECTIDSISQSWSVISEGADLDKAKIAMSHHEKLLEKADEQMVLLLTPPFETSKPFPGYIQGYPNGIRENGGQYTHGVVWAIKAYAMLGEHNKAYEIFNMLNPISHAESSDLIYKYKVEPYVMVADLYSNPQHVGRGGWSWYTGSAGWMYQTAVQDILGLSTFESYFTLNPNIPDSWSGFEMEYKYSDDCTFKIEVLRGSTNKKGVWVNKKIIADGKILYIYKGEVEVKVHL